MRRFKQVFKRIINEFYLSRIGMIKKNGGIQHIDDFRQIPMLNCFLRTDFFKDNTNLVEIRKQFFSRFSLTFGRIPPSKITASHRLRTFLKLFLQKQLLPNALNEKKNY